MLVSTTQRTTWRVVLLIIYLGTGAAFARDSTERAGYALATLIPAIGFGSTLFYEKGYEGTIQFSESLATSQATTEVLKRVIHERRPNGGCCKSFPSGHASAAFMGASFIHERYGWEYAIPAYAGATFVGYSRVQADKHYIHDVIAGGAIGVLSSFYFTEPYKGFTVTPVADSRVYGIRISKEW